MTQAVTEAVQGDNIALPFTVPALDARGRVVRLGSTIHDLLARHDYPEPVLRLLGEAAVLTLMLGTALKFEGRFVLQTQSDGPVSMMVVEFTTPDTVRATARFRKEDIDAAVSAGKTKPEELLGKGHLALTLDQGEHMEPYQGIVALQGQTLEDVAHGYFEQSEQIPTRIRLAVASTMTRGEDGKLITAWRAGGLMVQYLPEGERPEASIAEDHWREADSLAATTGDDELTDPTMTADRLLFRLYHERGVHVFDPLALREACSCSRERIETMLQGFSQDDRDHMVKDGKIAVTCEFCAREYSFAPGEVGANDEASQT